MVPAEGHPAGWNTFHAAILFGFEGLLAIGAVSEIGAAVGDKEGGIDFLLLNQFGQRLEITFYVGLSAAKHDRAHVDRNRPP
jgi:hypothetical protein